MYNIRIKTTVPGGYVRTLYFDGGWCTLVYSELCQSSTYSLSLADAAEEHINQCYKLKEINEYIDLR
jgi:hypothetical protein